MKAYGGIGGIVPLFLTLALDGDGWSHSRPCRFTPNTHRLEGGVVPRSGLEDVKKKYFALPGTEPQPSSP
jgi:hypothetical protein